MKRGMAANWKLRVVFQSPEASVISYPVPIPIQIIRIPTRDSAANIRIPLASNNRTRPRLRSNIVDHSIQDILPSFY